MKNEKIHDMFAYYWIVDPNVDEQTVIRIYGIDGDGKNICLNVVNFTPFCYIELPSIDAAAHVQSIVQHQCVETKVVFKKHLYNVYNDTDETSPFIHCRCASKKNINIITHIVNKRGIFIPGYGNCFLKVHEIEASPILQLVSIKDVCTAGWMKFKGQQVPQDEMTSTCDLEYNVHWKKICNTNKNDKISPKIFAFDIEVNSDFVTQMPSDRPGDVIFQISCVIVQDEKKCKYLFTFSDKEKKLSKCELLSGVTVFEFNKEEELLLAFLQLIVDQRPNVITGFNILGFDVEYIIKRCTRLFLMNELKSVGFYRNSIATEEKIKWSSSAYKNQEFKFINWEGILLLDLLPIIQRDHKLDTYSLKKVAQVFLKNEEKDPLTYKDIFNAYRTRTKLDQVGKYCVQDSNLCIELMNHLHSWISLSEMAKVCNVTMFALYTQGQQIKTYSQVYKYCLKENIIVNTNGYQTKNNERYTGAYVFDPVPGVYDKVVPFDFSSLYPSIIIAKNICYSTLVENKKVSDDVCHIFEWEDHVGCPHDSNMIEIDKLSIDIDTIGHDIQQLQHKRDEKVDGKKRSLLERKKIQDKINALKISQRPFREKRQHLKKSKPADREDQDGNKITGIICEKRHYRFYKSHVKKGVIPTIIQNLLDSRARVKKQIKSLDASQSSLALILDKEQNAYKISANSMYGAMGVRNGYLPLMPGAMCITYFGRQSIEMAAHEIVKHWKGELIYGDTDSNYVIFPHLKKVEDIWDHAVTTAEHVSKIFPSPMKLEFEQTIYDRFLILSKKRYIYQSMDRMGCLNTQVGKKGVVLSRRDNSNIVRSVYEKLSMLIFQRTCKKIIVDFVLEYINDLFRNVFPYNDYVITKSIGDTGEDGSLNNNKLGDYKIRKTSTDNPNDNRPFYISQCPAHVQLAEKMRQRGCPISAGSRIEFVVIKKQSFVTLADRIENYDYFLKRSDILRIDPEYYLHSLINPLDQLLNVGIQNDHFVKDQYAIRCCFEKVLTCIKNLGRVKIKINKKLS